MTSIYNLFHAVGNLARALNRLAGLADQLGDQVERKVELPGSEPVGVLEHEPAKGRRK